MNNLYLQVYLLHLWALALAVMMKTIYASLSQTTDVQTLMEKKYYWNYWKCNFPMTPYVTCLLNCWWDGRSVKFPKRGAKLHLHAPIGALVMYTGKLFYQNCMWETI